MTDDEYIVIKADIFRLIRVNSGEHTARTIMNEIRKQFPDVSVSTIRKILQELM